MIDFTLNNSKNLNPENLIKTYSRWLSEHSYKKCLIETRKSNLSTNKQGDNHVNQWSKTAKSNTFECPHKKP